MPSILNRKPLKFNCNGVDLAHPVDLMPDGYYPVVKNCRSIVAGTVSVRPGYTAQASGLNSGAPLHSIRRVNNLLPGAASPSQLFLGVGTSLLAGAPTAASFTSIATGLSGDPLSSVIFRPDQSPESWIYVADSLRMLKANCEQVVRNVGVAPPTVAPVPDIATVGGLNGVTNNGIIDDGNSTTGWAQGGTAGAVSDPTRVPASTTVANVLYDTGSNGWCIMRPENSGNYEFVQPGARLIITGSGGAETVTVTEVHDDAPDTTIAAIIYDSGTNGLCSIALSTQTPQITRNSMLLIGTSSVVRVLSVTVGPDGLSSLRCLDPFTHAAGDLIRSILSFRCYTTISIPNGVLGVPTSSTTITGDTLEITVATGTGYATKTVSQDLSVFAFTNSVNRPMQPDDYMHISLRFDVPGNISVGRILLDVDDTTNDFTSNYYYKEFRPSDLQSNTTGTLTSQVSLQTAIQNQIIDNSISDPSFGGGEDPFNGVQGVNVDNTPSNIPDPSELASSAVSQQLNTGTSQWTELFIKYSDLTRVGTNQGASLQQVAAIRVELTVTASTTMEFCAWWVAGGYGPDVQSNSPLGIQYRYRYRDSRTGTKSVPGPACRYQLFPQRQQINVGVTASTDPQVDTIDVEKFDPALANFVYAGSTPNTTGTFVDDTAASLIAGNPSFETNVFQPWPVLDTPKSGIVNVAGTSVNWVSGDQFQTSLVPGTVILIGNDTVQLYGQPASGTFLELTSNLGALNGVPYVIASPTLLGQPLPVLFGPLEGPTATFAFGIGDLRNPGTLYWTNGNDLDSASDANTLEVTSPSEPLVSGCVWQSLIYVASAKRVFLVTPSFSTNAKGTQVVVFTSTELTSISGSFSPWGMVKGSQGVYMNGRDGQYVLNYNSGSYYSQQLWPIYPHDGQPATSVNGYATIDPTNPQRYRLSYCDSSLFLDVSDTNLNFSSYEIDINGGFWPQFYPDAVVCHYWEEVPQSVEPRLLMGTFDGNLLVSGGATDDGSTLVGTIRTPSIDGGDPRTLKLFMDTMTDSDGGWAATVGFNNYQEGVVSLGAGGSNSGRVQSLLSVSSIAVAGLKLYRNLAVEFTLAAGTTLYEFEPSFFSQPFTSKLYTTQLMDHGIPGWKQLRFGRFALISTTDVLIQILNDDGVTLNSFTVPSTNGILFNDFTQLQNASKGRLLRYSASSTTEFVLFTDKTFVRIKKWGGPQFLEVRPFLD